MANKIIAFSKSFPVLWSDLDPNGHMRVPRYLEYSAEMPFHFLAENGFDFRLFAKEQSITRSDGVDVAIVEAAELIQRLPKDDDCQDLD